MNEQDLTRRLGLLTDDPVAPPDELRLELWLAIEEDLARPSATEAEDRRYDEEGPVPVEPSTPHLRWVGGPVRAAAVFLVVLALGALAFWLRPRELPDQMVDTTGPSPSVTATAGTVPTGRVQIDGAGTISLPEGYFPQAIADAGGALVVVVAERAPHITGTPPQELGTVLAIDRGSGEIHWERNLDGGPTLMEPSGDVVWVAHFWSGAVTKLDLRSGDVLSTVDVELPFDVGNGPDRRHFIPNDLEVAFGSLWMSTARGAIAEIDLESGALIRVTAVSSDGSVLIDDIEPTDRHMWIGVGGGGVVVLDPQDHSMRGIGPLVLDHAGSWLAFHRGVMFVGGITPSGAPHVTGLDQVAFDRHGSTVVPGSSAFLVEVGDRLFAFGGGVLWPIDAQVTLGEPVRLPVTGSIGDGGATLWLIDAATRKLRPLTIDDLVVETVTTTPGGAGAPNVAWRRVGIGMDNSTLATSGRIVVADGERVYVADGFGGPDGGTTLGALSAGTGEVVWVRDLVDEPGNIFIQTVVDGTLVVNDQVDTVWALDAATGEIRWTFAIPTYGAVGSVVTGDTLVLTVDAQSEGDTRPPVVYGLDLAEGAVRWQTTLTEGTDLQWHSPALGDGVVVVSSTLSHPQSAPGNMIHAVDLGTGAIRWTVDLGGEQGFHHAPTLIDSGTVLVRGPDGIVALDLSDGSERWRSPNLWPLAVMPSGELLAADGSPYGGEAGDVVLLDPVTGSPSLLIAADPSIGFPLGDVFVQDGSMILATRSGLRGFDLDGSLLWSWNALSPVVDLPALAGGLVAVPTADRSVVAISLP